MRDGNAPRWLRALAGVTLVAGLASQTLARTKPRPDARWGDHVDTLARVCVLEADGSLADCAAIAWTLDHRLAARATRTPESVMRYSAPLHREHPSRRVAEILGPVDAMSSARAAQVVAARELVARWLAGDVPDTCPLATDWAGVSDAWPGSLVKVSCGATRNTFGRRAR